jgi:hypothetical protein
LNERCIWGYPIDEGKCDGAAFVASQNTISPCNWRKDKELDNTATESVQREEGADTTSGKIEPTREFEWKVDIW